MSILKKLLIFIMISVIITVLLVGISKNNVSASSKF